jgi:SAM-dependent methyltransferase
VPWFHELAERDHELQNPTSADKVRLLGEYMRLGEGSRVLDLACGKGGPAIVLASAFGCRILGVERHPAFADEARRRVRERALEEVVEIETADAAAFEPEPGAWDAALCLGASFVWGTIADAAAALRPAVRPGGSIAIGEPFWRQWPLPHGVETREYTSLEDTVARLEGAGVALTGLIAASEADWDRYESLQWRALEEWFAEHGDDPDADEIRNEHQRARTRYLRQERALLGWAIFIGRVP